MPLRDDLRTVKSICRKKSLVKSMLRETTSWFLPGLWYVEGPYARHASTTLPIALRDSIWGIRTRQRTRRFVEHLVPPWAFIVPSTGPARSGIRCSIAYLSNGGNWKLFDLENQAIWTRPLNQERLSQQIANLEHFGAFFNIPAWRIESVGQKTWRYDTLLDAPSLAFCSANEREKVVKKLLGQYAAFARAKSSPPQPALTQLALSTVKNLAPDSFPARATDLFRTELDLLGAGMKLVPEHGDLSAQNVLVSKGEPWLIDWDTAGRSQPTLYDVHYLVLREAELRRPDLLQAFLRGAFDEELNEVYAASGFSEAPCENFVALVHSYILHFHTKRITGQRDAYAGNVDRLWEQLRPYVGDRH